MTFIVIFHLLLVLAFTARILLRDDLSPPARLAWFIVLSVLPYFGVVVYFLFGEVDIGNKAIKSHNKVFATIKNQAQAFMGQSQNTEKLINPLYRPGFRYASSINGFHTCAGNSAKLMADNNATLKQLISDIDNAQDHVHVLYYIWLNDHTGQSIASALMRAAKRGVTCRAMADGLGSRALIEANLWQQMREAGVQLAVALPFRQLIRTLLLSRLDLRNHRKITIIDSRITYCGSQNAADAEFLPKARFAPWVDIMLRLEGPVVAQNQLLFASDWVQATGEPLEVFNIKALPQKEGFAAQVIGVGPTERSRASPQLFANLIASAETKLIISTPYFVPDATVLEALCAAALRGVEVTLIFPKVNDSWVVSAASRSYYHQLLSAGCKIYEFTGGLLHAKTLTIDGVVSLIGSSNIDLRSFDLNYENNMLLQDAATTAAIVERQKSYIAESESVALETVLAWSYPRRVWNNVIATIGPVL